MPRTVSSRSMSLLTESEAQLVLASASRNVTELTPRALKGKTQRARKLVGKYQDLARRQRREAIGKREPTRGRQAQHNMNTVRKAALIQTALERFEKRLELLERKAERAALSKAAAAHRTPRRAATASAKRRAAGHAPGEATTRKRASATTRKTSTRVVATGAKSTRSGTGKVLAAAATKKGGALKKSRAVGIGRAAHAGSQGRRNQTKRDVRG